jgi:2-hydroxy-3-keto-5-methylthiopentenyl-1-phosphate phosphatase
MTIGRRRGTVSENGPIVFCDFDGTITNIDVTDEILTQLAHPSWREVEQAWVQGLIGSRECLERQIALVQASEKELNALIDSIEIDPHFFRFYRFIQKHAVPFYVLSDGFDHVVRRVLRHAGVNGELRNGSHLFTSALHFEGRRLAASFPNCNPPCGHGCATCKPRIIRRVGDKHRPIIYIGDGLSDRFAVAESDVIFAKRQLLVYCREAGIGYHPFETFADVEEVLREQVEGRKSKVKSHGMKIAVAVGG